MPFRDRTDPNGKDPKTGFGLGDCEDKKNPDRNIPNDFGRGLGRGLGRLGRGFRFRFYQRNLKDPK